MPRISGDVMPPNKGQRWDEAVPGMPYGASKGRGLALPGGRGLALPGGRGLALPGEAGGAISLPGARRGPRGRGVVKIAKQAKKVVRKSTKIANAGINAAQQEIEGEGFKKAMRKTGKWLKKNAPKPSTALGLAGLAAKGLAMLPTPAAPALGAASTALGLSSTAAKMMGHGKKKKLTKAQLKKMEEYKSFLESITEDDLVLPSGKENNKLKKKIATIAGKLLKLQQKESGEKISPSGIPVEKYMKKRKAKMEGKGIRKPSAYNLHVQKEMKGGKSMKEAAASWRK